MAIAFAATATASDTTGVALTTSLGTTAANQLIVAGYADDSATSTTFISMTDSKGNTYTPCGVFLLNSVSYRMFYAVTTLSGAAHTVTALWSTVAAARATVVAQYFNGFTGTPTLDQTTQTTGTSTSAAPGTTGTTVNANEVVVIGAAHAATVSAFTLGTGYTNLGTVSVANAQNGMESKIVAATGTQTGVMTIAASRAWAAVIATFQDVTGGAVVSAPGMMTMGTG